MQTQCPDHSNNETDQLTGTSRPTNSLTMALSIPAAVLSPVLLRRRCRNRRSLSHLTVLQPPEERRIDVRSRRRTAGRSRRPNPRPLRRTITRLLLLLRRLLHRWCGMLRRLGIGVSVRCLVLVLIPSLIVEVEVWYSRRLRLSVALCGVGIWDWRRYVG
jgi:hypothetical protein